MAGDEQRSSVDGVSLRAEKLGRRVGSGSVAFLFGCVKAGSSIALCREVREQ
jgi:hypothetical protein